MESVKRCTVRFLDGNMAVVEADHLEFQEEKVIAYRKDEVVGVFNLNTTACVYMTQSKAN